MMSKKNAEYWLKGKNRQWQTPIWIWHLSFFGIYLNQGAVKFIKGFRTDHLERRENFQIRGMIVGNPMGRCKMRVWLRQVFEREAHGSNPLPVPNSMRLWAGEGRPCTIWRQGIWRMDPRMSDEGTGTVLWAGVWASNKNRRETSRWTHEVGGDSGSRDGWGKGLWVWLCQKMHRGKGRGAASGHSSLN